MKEDCPVCESIHSNEKKLYEDDKVVALMSKRPCTEGHVIVMPKEHYPIIELVPDYIISHLFTVVNKISIAVFDAVSAQGTNILVNNGIAAGQEWAHFMVHIIPRKEGDELSFVWNPKQLSEEEMSTIELNFKEETKNIGVFEEEKPKPVSIDKKKKEEVRIEEEENYMINQLRRIP